MKARLIADGIDETSPIPSYSFPGQMPIPGVGMHTHVKLQFDIEFHYSDIVGTFTLALTAREATQLAHKLLSYCSDNKAAWKR
jgi:hypothetical protein